MIKLIIFDLSGVFFTNEEPPFVEAFAKKHHLPEERFINRYLEMVKAAEADKVTGKGAWRTLAEEFGFSADPEKIIADMIAMKEAHEDMLALSAKLKERCTTVYLTNYNKDYWDVIKEKFDFTKWFSWGVVSYEIGFRKPAKEGFLYILKKAGCKPEEAVFVDDSPGNLEPARELGINVILFETRERLVEKLAALGM
jgi:putative hydrolase of the HAD superfamily